MPRFGPRILIPAGLLLAAGGMVILASQLGVTTSYAAWILPALVVIGLGLGLVFGCGLNTATYGADAGRRRGGVGHGQHLPAGRRLDRHRPAQHHRRQRADQLPGHARHQPAAQAGAAVHSYVVAFWVSAAIFAGAAVDVRAGAAVGRAHPGGHGRRPSSPERRPADVTAWMPAHNAD